MTPGYSHPLPRHAPPLCRSAAVVVRASAEESRRAVLGGLLAGALLGFILPAAADRLPAPTRWLRTAAAAGLSAALLLGGWMLAANMPQIQQIKAIMLQ